MNRTPLSLAELTPERLRGMRRGLEKESLRATRDGALAHTPHPAALGSALTHPHITTDFSESQLELITGVHGSVESCLAELEQVQRFTAAALGDEMMWVASMPCDLPQEDQIPIGTYGSSNVARAKSVYRTGLGHRYGRRMQTISGIHYNWSLPGLDSAQYFALIRNFRRHAFLLLVLFGATPAVCTSFVAGRSHALQSLRGRSLYLPHATSLRMGRLGYQSDAQAALAVSYNGLEGYAHSLEAALTQPYPAYQALGVQGPDGQYRQLATSLLQIENEFYGTIRPKRVIRPGERPLHALRERGVEYLEVRLMDLNPFEPLGISAATMRFLDIFLLHCLLQDSPPDSPEEIAALGRNQQLAAERGRESGLLLERGSERVELQQWGLELIAQMQPIATQVDAYQGSTLHQDALQQARQGLLQPLALPSAQVLRVVQEDYDGSFAAFARARSLDTRQAMRAPLLDAQLQAQFERQAQDSLAAQRAIEAADTVSFDDYLRHYLAPERLTV